MGHRRLVVAASLAALLFGFAGCVGEASVRYRGTVLAGEAPQHLFSEAPNPDGASPIADATVSVCITYGDEQTCAPDRVGQTVQSDADGVWTIDEFVFGGSAFADTKIMIRVEKDGYQPYTYRVTFEKTKDPKKGEKLLNIVLAGN